MKNDVFKIILSFLLIFLFTNCKGNKPKDNIENIKKVELGMFKVDIIKIMGEPDQILSGFPLENVDSTYSYQLNFFESDAIYIHFNKNEAVEVIYKPE